MPSLAESNPDSNKDPEMLPIVSLVQAQNALDCAFPAVQRIFPDWLEQVQIRWSAAQITASLAAARTLCRLGRGEEPVLAFLESWPQIEQILGAESLSLVMDGIHFLHHSPNGSTLVLFLTGLPEIAAILESRERLQEYLTLIREIAEKSRQSIHGRDSFLPSAALPEFLGTAPRALQHVSLGGLATWARFGLDHYAKNPDRQADYFALQSADSRAILQSQRRGTLLATVERQLECSLRGLWDLSLPLLPFSASFHQLRKPYPYCDALGIHVPDVLEPVNGVSGLDQYRLMVAHMAGHRRYSQPLLADNLSPFQRLYLEVVEDARIDFLLLRRYPGLRSTLLALHPHPLEDACDPKHLSCIRHRLILFSRAVLDPDHGYQDATLLAYVQRFLQILAEHEGSTQAMAQFAGDFLSATRLASDGFAKVHFAETEAPYRDDNRHLWRFIDADQEEDETTAPNIPAAPNENSGIMHFYPEWDFHSHSYRPHWVTLYEHLHPQGDARRIDTLLRKHDALARMMQRLLDSLIPQGRERLRHQEDGAELDLDWALRSFIAYRGGQNPDPRIQESTRPVRRDLAISLLLDLSASLNDRLPSTGEQSVLDLAVEAVTLLAWAINRLGDPFAIAGFHSNTRHEARYWHIKGFEEPWSVAGRARLAALEAGFSTRMGVALRHAGHYLAGQNKEKRLLLLLTDGEPADVDVDDPEYLVADTREAVRELKTQGIFCHCISLDPHADGYVSKIFGNHFSIIDHIEKLPEKLPEIFFSLLR